MPDCFMVCLMHGLQVRRMQSLQGGINEFIPWAGSGLVAEPEYFLTGAVYVPCTLCVPPCYEQHVNSREGLQSIRPTANSSQ